MSSGQGVNRVSIKYRARLAPIGPEAFGVTAFMVSVQGKPYRPPKAGEDLQDVREWLEYHGFTLTDTARAGGGRRDHYDTRYTETYHLHPPEPEPTRAEPIDTTITHNPISQRWEIRSPLGDVLTDSPDETTARWSQLAIYNPELHRYAFGLHARHPQLGSRALSAGLIVARGWVTLNGSPHTFDIQSRRTDGRVYRTAIPPNELTSWTCQIRGIQPEQQDNRCPDIVFGAPQLTNGRRCGHMTAAWLTTRLSQPPPMPALRFDPPDPFDLWAERREARRDRIILEHEETMAINRQRIALGMDPLT